jgi:hypothetical protein
VSNAPDFPQPERRMIFLNEDPLKIAVQTIDSQHTSYTMTSGKQLPELNGAIMKNARQDAAVIQAKTQFNYNKLQAAACMTSSAAVSIGLLYLAIRWLA